MGYPRWMRSARAQRLRDLALGLAAIGWVLVLAALAVYMVLLMILTPGAVQACEERGGWVVWEVDRAASTAYGECVGAVP